tara:strand:+ start:3555 stop:3713 length:159 start_codon:yes stop_codon:yes gene_type:complete
MSWFEYLVVGGIFLNVGVVVYWLDEISERLLAINNNLEQTRKDINDNHRDRY